MPARSTRSSTVAAYYHVLKPGIIYGNSIALIAGFILATSRFDFRILSLLGVLVGSACVIGAGCVFNNIIERYTDAKMARTKHRELVTGRITVPAAAAYASVLTIVGFVLLYFLVNPLTALVGLIGFTCYVVVYTYMKRYSPTSTFIGAISGAIPPVAGYTALSGRVDMTALGLFLVLAVWQLPHFFAISIRRRDEYANAGMPVLAVVYGTSAARKVTMLSVIVFALVAPLLWLTGSLSLLYVIGMIATGLWWINAVCIKWKRLDDTAWAKKTFGSSLSVLLVFSGLVSVGGFLP